MIGMNSPILALSLLAILFATMLAVKDEDRVPTLILTTVTLLGILVIA